MAKAHRRSGHAARLGITGPPGAGKSTLLAALLPHLPGAGVLAVDPSSQLTGGALLGDRFRLDPAKAGKGVFFRSVAHRGGHGGLSLAVRAMAAVLEAAGKRWIVVETVGAGQSELQVLGLVDTLVAVLVPESGDYIQALKAGIMEAGDILVVNKMDRDGAVMLRDELVDVLSYSRARRFEGWEPRVLMTNAREGKGVEEVLGAIRDHQAFLRKGGRLAALRRAQARQAVEEILQAEIAARVDPAAVAAAAGRVAAGRSDPYAEAARLAGRMLA